MKKFLLRVLACVTIISTLSLSTAFASEKLAAKRAELEKKCDSTLELLYQKKPNARRVIDNSSGYAVFANSGYKLGLLGSSHGRGMAFNNRTGEKIYMRMNEFTLGLGFGAKEYAMIFVFPNQAAWKNFTEKKWEYGGKADASATDGVNGGSVEGAVYGGDGIWVYEMTTKGLTLEMNLKGTRYYKDDSMYPKKAKKSK
jgi:lipid-binding SYLF domain-containing protein